MVQDRCFCDMALLLAERLNSVRRIAYAAVACILTMARLTQRRQVQTNKAAQTEFIFCEHTIT